MKNDREGTAGKKITGATSSFGDRGGKHEGVDLPGKTGDTVVSTAPGKIIRAGWEDPNDHKKGYGQFVEIQHENGTLTRYGHLSKIDVKPGEMVESGQKIAEVGSTGHSTGPHLHYEVLKDGKKIDPSQSGAFNLNPVIPESKLSSSDMKYRETQNIKKEMKTNGQQVSILNNNTNIIGGGTTYLISQKNVSNYSSSSQKQFNYLS
jgi:murein DD-endopeptidase MepM/ murein hydrolase activator NlpD